MTDAPSAARSAPTRLGAVARLLTAGIRGYQVVTAGRPPSCRYDPTCSAYALDAVRGLGAVRGAWAAARRLARCHPWGGAGYDPVPLPPVEPGPPQRGLTRA